MTEQKSYTGLMLKFDDPVGFLKGVTPAVRKAWHVLGIDTISDLLLTLPRRYDDFSKTVAIRELQHEDVVTVRGRVVGIKKISTFRRSLNIVRVTIDDGTGKIAANFFNQPWMLTQLKPNQELCFSGKVKIEPPYGKSLLQPLWELTDSDTLAAGKIAPVYGLTGTLAQKTYRRLVALALESVDMPEDPLPADILRSRELMPLASAIKAVHAPEIIDEAERGRERLAFDELLAYQLALQIMKRSAQAAGALAVAFDQAFAKRFVAHLPYPLTGDQKRAVWAIMQDLERSVPMRRLLQGDVGSGKTVVAAFVAAHVERAGGSVAILAPTDILARQHAKTLRSLLAPFHIPLLLVTRTDKRSFFDGRQEELANDQIADRIRSGNIVVVGTHALLERGRIPPDIALAVVDEQHRFGVSQREILASPVRADGRVAHLLSMTATPIPRSLALTMHGDLDLSLIREKPKGRLPITTRVCVGTAREAAYTAIRAAVVRGERAYIVCPLIDPSDAMGVRSVTEEMKRLTAGSLLGLSLGLLHGRLKAADKDEIMQRFAQGGLQILIATSVIEVGIDVPEATVIAIEGAERFGLAQLHQLRGRVGRSSRPSQCFLLTDMEGAALDRLRLVEKHQDGLELAEADLRLRGSGNLIGLEQSGYQSFRAVKLYRDVDLIRRAQLLARTWLENDPGLDDHVYWKERAVALQETRHVE